LLSATFFPKIDSKPILAINFMDQMDNGMDFKSPRHERQKFYKEMRNQNCVVIPSDRNMKVAMKLDLPHFDFVEMKSDKG
jgi:hypothetical protein